MASSSVSSEMALQFVQSSSTANNHPLRVTEHLLSFVSRAMPARVELVTDAEQALHIPWIAKLPGDKRIEHWRGQMVIMQHYLHHNLVRAEITFPER